jgi:predicted RNase H-like nuclease (RuvC/YqgF family)
MTPDEKAQSQAIRKLYAKIEKFSREIRNLQVKIENTRDKILEWERMA